MYTFSELYIICKSKLSIIASIAGLIFTCIIYTILNKIDNFLFIFLLIYSEILLLIVIGFILFYKIKFTIKQHKYKKFHRQIIVLFSCVTVIPASLVFIFAVVFFNIGIEHLFKSPIKDVMENNTELINLYINDNKTILENCTRELAESINHYIDGIIIDKDKISEILTKEIDNSNIDAMIFQIADNSHINIIFKSTFSLAIQYLLPSQNLNLFPVNTPISYEINDFIVSIQKLSDQLGIYLILSSPISQTIINNRNKVQLANKQYAMLSVQRSGIKITFMMLFFFITLLLLLIVIFFGLIFANWILAPVTKLIIAANNISSGEYKTIIVLKKFNNEWDDLITTFNNMVEQLEHQKRQLIISNKQIAWRDLARKIAHEVKNPLTPILLSAERIKNKYKKEIVTSPEIFDMCLDTIIRQVNCISRLIKEFSDFARMPAPIMENNDIIKLLKEVIFIQSNANKNILFDSEFEQDVLMCKVDAGQINQVMMNVIQNAINAINENNFTNDNTCETIGNIFIKCYLQNETIFITIEDNGPGFTDIALQKALEPYFTTRKFGNGLGLAIVYKIINDHGGEVLLSNSKVLRGAKITITIPYTILNYEGGVCLSTTNLLMFL